MLARPVPADRTSGRRSGITGDTRKTRKDDPDGTYLGEVTDVEGKTRTKRPYVPPFIKGEFVLRTDHPVLGGSPPVQPGGGGGGSISIEDPIEDPGDNELIGARMPGFRADWGN